MTWTLHAQNADHSGYRKVGTYSTKGNARRKMNSLVDFKNEYVENTGGGRMREDFDVLSNWLGNKKREYWYTMDL